MARHTNEWWCSTRETKAGLGELAIRGGRVASVSQAAKAILDFVATLFLARLLAPSDFGLVGMVAAMTGFVALFNDLGLATVTVQRDDLEPDDVRSLFWLNALLGASLALLVALVAPLIAAYYREPRLTPIARVLGLSFVLTGLSVQHRALLRRRMLNARLALVELAEISTGLGVALWLAFAGWGPWAIVLKSPIGAAVGALGAFLACDFRPGLPFRSPKLRSLLGGGARLTGFSVVNYFARNLDNMLLGRYAGAQALGLYAKAYDLLLLPLRQVSEPASAIAIPSLSRLVDEPDRYRQAFVRILEKVLLLTLPLGAFLVSASDAIVVLVFGPRWSEAGPIFFWLGWLTFTQPIGNATGWLFVSQGRTAELLRWGVIGAGLAIASFLVGLPWGAVGVAASYSLSGIALRLPLVLYFVGRRGPVRALHVVRAASPLFGAGALALAGALGTRWALDDTSPLVVVAGCGAVAVTTTVLALLPLASGRRALADLRLILSLRKGSAP